MLDHQAPDRQLPPRSSDDKRNVSSHGKRVLQALSDYGIIVNGIIAHGFSGAFTRMPNRTSDRPSVINYVCAPPSILPLVLYGGLEVLPLPADLSDHHPVSLSIHIGEASTTTENGVTHFQSIRLSALKVPTDAETWDTIE